MKVKLVRIGNSRGIRIPKAVLEQCGLQEAAELRVERDHLVIARDADNYHGKNAVHATSSSL